MKTIRPPKDYTRLKSAVVSRFLNFCTTKAWVYICMFFSFGIFFALGIRDAKIVDYSGWWMAITVLFIALPHVIFRGVFRYGDIPQGYTLEQARALWRLEEKSKQVKGVSRPSKWKKVGKALALVVVYIIMLNLVLFLVTTLDKSGIGVLVFIISAIIAPFVYMKIFRPNILQNNTISLVNAVMEAKLGIHYRKWIFAFIGFSIGMLPIMMLIGTNVLLFAPVYIGVLIYIIKKAGGRTRVKIKI